MSAKIVAPKEKTLRFGIVGTGHCGSKLAEAFYTANYPAVCINTATQDLRFINLPDANKFHLDYGVGGASRDLNLGEEAAQAHRDEILELIRGRLTGTQINILCTSLGGGSGAGSVEVMLDVLAQVGKPIVVLAVLPMTNEDSQLKANALETLAKLAKHVQSKKISNLLVIDNAKIETIYHQVSQINFYDEANKSIVNVLDELNTVTSLPSQMKAFDGAEWLRVLLEGNGLSVCGELSIINYRDETAIAEAVIDNLTNNLLADGFDLKQTKYAGFVILANRETWNQIPAASISYAATMVSDLCGQPRNIFKGLYCMDEMAPGVKIISFFSGLGLPTPRVDSLKEEVKSLQNKVQHKDEEHNLNLALDTGVSENVSAAQRIKNKIAGKNSAFNKVMGGVIDRRRNKQ